MANMVNRLTKNRSGVLYVERRNWDVKTRLLSSIAKAKKLLDWEPKTSFEEGLEAVYQWFVVNFEHIKKSAEF